MKLRVDGCLWDRSPHDGKRLPFGGCRLWKRLATDTRIQFNGDGWALLSLPGGVAITKSAPPSHFLTNWRRRPAWAPRAARASVSGGAVDFFITSGRRMTTAEIALAHQADAVSFARHVAHEFR